MYKKLLPILIVLLFLITSLSVICAADDSNTINVHIVWKGDSTDEVTVNLIKDDQIVDSAKLSTNNSWKTTFKVDDDGNYDVKEVISEDYTTKVTGNAKDGFIITNTLVKEDVLGADGNTVDDEVSQSENDVALDDGSQNNANDQSDNTNGQTSDDQSAAGNGTDNNSTDNNSTDNATDTNSDDETDSTDEDSSEETTTKTTKTTTTTTKVVKEDKKKPENTTKTKKNNTGFPIIVLVIAVFAAAFIPFSRKK